MQINEKIQIIFNKKGYYPGSIMSKRQFHILMNTLMTVNYQYLSQKFGQQSNLFQNNNLFNQNLTSEIWRKTLQRAHDLDSPISKKKRSLVTNQKYEQVKIQYLIATLTEAIKILSNHIIQNTDKIQQLTNKKDKYEEQMKFEKSQQLNSRIQMLKQQLDSFRYDFKMLMGPFDHKGQGKKDLLRKASATRKKQTFKSDPITDKKIQKKNTSLNKELQEEKQIQLFERKISKLQSDSDSRNREINGDLNGQDDRKCALYVLIIIFVLQMTVSLIKFNNVNLICHLLGFLVLSFGDKSFKPSMVRITLYCCVFSLIIDILWLFFQSNTYLLTLYNSGLKHQLKAFFQYIWFITVLQLFLKTIYVYFLYQYQKINHQRQKQELQKQDGTNLDQEEDNNKDKETIKQNNNNNKSLKKKNTIITT